MPAQDINSLTWKFHQHQGGAAYTSSILKPEGGRGHHEFVNDVVDPMLGQSPPWTGTGGGTWQHSQFNNRATVVKPSNREGFRLYVADFVPAEFLEDRSYMGQSAIGNMIPGNVAGFIYFVIILACTLIQSDGKTGLEKLHQQRKTRPAPPGKEPSSAGVSRHSGQDEKQPRKRAREEQEIQRAEPAGGSPKQPPLKKGGGRSTGKGTLMIQALLKRRG